MILSVVLGLVALWIFAGVVVLGLCWSAARGDRARTVAAEPVRTIAPHAPRRGGQHVVVRSRVSSRGA